MKTIDSDALSTVTGGLSAAATTFWNNVKKDADGVGSRWEKTATPGFGQVGGALAHVGGFVLGGIGSTIVRGVETAGNAAGLGR